MRRPKLKKLKRLEEKRLLEEQNKQKKDADIGNFIPSRK